MKKYLVFLFVLITSITLYASDAILSHTLGAYYCSKEPNPKTYIKHTVEEPISIYWEDNVYPGFDDADAELMVKNYLDGVHLKTMALNTPDGKVKVYSYKELPQSYVDLFQESEVTKKEMILNERSFNKARGLKDYPPDFNQIRDAYLQVMNKNIELARQIDLARTKLALIVTETTREPMAQMNYTIKTDEVHLSTLASKVIYSDEVKITDNRTNEVIGYNRRIMQLYSASLLPDFQGGNYYVSDPMCGNGTELFERGIFITLNRGTSRKFGPNGGRYAKKQKIIGEK